MRELAQGVVLALEQLGRPPVPLLVGLYQQALWVVRGKCGSP
jgi:hypothetical protein